MSESKYWIQVIEWLHEKDLTFAFHNSHKSELMKNYKVWINDFEKKYGRSIPVHSIKIKNSYSDFLVLKSDDFESIYYIYSYEVKGEVDRAGFNRGLIQAENLKDGIDYSVLLIPKQSIKRDYEKELNYRGILLGEIDEKEGVIVKNESIARTHFNPKLHNKILKFLLIIKQKKEGEIISKIKSTKTIFLHYLVAGFIKYLYEKYEKKDLMSNDLEEYLKTHWIKLIKRKNWDEILSNKPDSIQAQINHWNTQSIKNFIKISRQFGFLNKNDFFFSCIELYLESIIVPKQIIFTKIQNEKIRSNITKLYCCAEDMNGQNRWLFKPHTHLSNIILDFLLRRNDMKIINKWIKNVLLSVSTENELNSRKEKGINFRDIIDYVSKIDFILMKEIFIKGSIGKRSHEKDICLNPIGNLKCPLGSNEKCYGKTINNFFNLIEFNKEIIKKLNDSSNPIENYDDIPKEFHENNNKNDPLRYGIVKALADSQIYYNFKRNLINLGYFPKRFIYANQFLKKFKYPIGNDTPIGNYCPYLDVWSVDLENDILNN